MLERLAQHESRLRHRPLECVDQEQHAVRHLQDALDLSTEIRVPRRVDQVDFVFIAVGIGVVNGAVLTQDRDAALPLQRIRVHNQSILASRQLVQLFGPKHPRLVQ